MKERLYDELMCDSTRSHEKNLEKFSSISGISFTLNYRTNGKTMSDDEIANWFKTKLGIIVKD